jgi:hypothetical protein
MALIAVVMNYRAGLARQRKTLRRERALPPDISANVVLCSGVGWRVVTRSDEKV